MEIFTGTFNFGQGGGERYLSDRITFPRAVKQSYIGLSGYSLYYIDDDHNVKTITVRLKIEPPNPEIGPPPYYNVDFSAIVNLRDNDLRAYEGFVNYVLFVEFDKPGIDIGSTVNHPLPTL